MAVVITPMIPAAAAGVAAPRTSSAPLPASVSPAAMAFRLMRNYDGTGGAFGETSVRATTTTPYLLTAYAAVRASDGALTLLVVNQSLEAMSATISLAACRWVGRTFASIRNTASAKACPAT